MSLHDHVNYDPVKTFEPHRDKKENFDGFVSLVESLFDQDYGRFEYDEKKGILTLATGGWSCNEALIGAIECNSLVMQFWWQKSERGGLHVFGRQGHG